VFYTYGAEADLQCRQIEDGKLLWEKRLSAAHTPIWGFSCSPLIDGDKIIVAGGDPPPRWWNEEVYREPLWSALPARDPGYSSPILITAGGVRQLIMWNPSPSIRSTRKQERCIGRNRSDASPA